MPTDALRSYVDAPRIQVLLSPAAAVAPDTKGAAGPFDAWLVVHVPDGGDPVTIKLAGSPFDRAGAAHLIEAVATTIAERYAPPEALAGVPVIARRPN